MADNKTGDKTPGQKKKWGVAPLAISLGCLAFVGWLIYDKKKASAAANATAGQATGLSQPVCNSIGTVGATTPLTFATPTTSIQNATNDTEVYPVSVTDPNGLSIEDFNYGVSTSPQFTGQQGISYKEYQELVG